MSKMVKPGFVAVVKVSEGLKTFNIDRVRPIRQEQYEALFGKKQPAKGEKIVRLNDEQIERLENGEEITVAEMGIFQGNEGVKLAAENVLLKKENLEKDSALENALAELAELKIQQSAAKETVATPAKGAKPTK